MLTAIGRLTDEFTSVQPYDLLGIFLDIGIFDFLVLAFFDFSF